MLLVDGGPVGFLGFKGWIGIYKKGALKEARKKWLIQNLLNSTAPGEAIDLNKINHSAKFT